MVEAGGVINPLALIGGPGEYGETVVEAAVRKPALILSLSAAAFQATLSKASAASRRAQLVVRKMAETRGKLLSKAALQAALPGFSDSQLQSIAINTSTEVLPKKGNVLIEPSASDATAEEQASAKPNRRATRRGRGNVKVAAAAQPQALGLGEAMFIVVYGELEGENAAGSTSSLGEGSMVTTPLQTPAAADIGVVVRATSKAELSIVCRLELGEASAEALASEEALIAEHEAREKMKGDCAAARKQVVELEKRLGLRPKRDLRRLWQWSYRRVRIYNAFGMEMEGGGNLEVAGGSLEQEMLSLQQRLASLDQTIKEREGVLTRSAAKWESYQPLFLPEELSLSVDTDSADLSVSHLSDVEMTISKIEKERGAHRQKLIWGLEKLWANANLSLAEQRAILSSAPGIDNASLHSARACA